MSIEASTVVEKVTLVERPDGTRRLMVYAGKKQFDLVFSSELWEKFAEDARWFRDNVEYTQEEQANARGDDVQVSAVRPEQGAPDSSGDGAKDA